MGISSDVVADVEDHLELCRARQLVLQNKCSCLRVSNGIQKLKLFVYGLVCQSVADSACDTRVLGLRCATVRPLPSYPPLPPWWVVAFFNSIYASKHSRILSQFYSEAILSRRGPLGKVWLAAHWERKLSKAQTLQTDIGESVGNVIYAVSLAHGNSLRVFQV